MQWIAWLLCKGRTHFVWHCGGAHFASDGPLLEVAQADVAPNIPVKVQQDCVEAGDDTKELCNVVMGLDLHVYIAIVWIQCLKRLNARQ